MLEKEERDGALVDQLEIKIFSGSLSREDGEGAQRPWGGGVTLLTKPKIRGRKTKDLSSSWKAAKTKLFGFGRGGDQAPVGQSKVKRSIGLGASKKKTTDEGGKKNVDASLGQCLPVGVKPK